MSTYAPMSQTMTQAPLMSDEQIIALFNSRPLAWQQGEIGRLVDALYQRGLIAHDSTDDKDLNRDMVQFPDHHFRWQAAHVTKIYRMRRHVWQIPIFCKAWKKNTRQDWVFADENAHGLLGARP